MKKLIPLYAILLSISSLIPVKWIRPRRYTVALA